MILTLTIKYEKEYLDKDIQVNSQQKVEDTLNVLIDAGILHKTTLLKELRIRSIRRGGFIEKKQSYDQANIHNGDILELI